MNETEFEVRIRFYDRDNITKKELTDLSKTQTINDYIKGLIRTDKRKQSNTKRIDNLEREIQEIKEDNKLIWNQLRDLEKLR